jgi:hypothetical protein
MGGLLLTDETIARRSNRVVCPRTTGSNFGKNAPLSKSVDYHSITMVQIQSVNLSSIRIVVSFM